METDILQSLVHLEQANLRIVEKNIHTPSKGKCFGYYTPPPENFNIAFYMPSKNLAFKNPLL